jgi:hypothetical protein
MSLSLFVCLCGFVLLFIIAAGYAGGGRLW